MKSHLNWIVTAAVVLGAVPLYAQPPGKTPDKSGAGKKDNQPPEANLSLAEQVKVAGLQAVDGPNIGKINSGGASESIAEIAIPAKHVFLAQPSASKFALLTQNTGGEKWGGVLLLPEGSQFLVFMFDPIGYIKDADKEKIDANGLMNNMKEGNKQQSEQRKKMGLPPFDLVGWETPPFYDPETKNLTWATRLKENQSETINHDVRLLGRKGVMRVTLVCDPKEYKTSQAVVNPLLKSFTFTKGNTYGEFTSGDKIAAYGLAGLIAGGGVALAAKAGLLAQLGKFMKVIVVGVIAAGAAFFKFFGSLFGGRRRD